MKKANNETLLGQRLLTVSKYIRDGAVLCDVGTDHAKLPIYLASIGKIKKAYATDINEGPIKTAEKNVKMLGYSSVIECIKTDGLENTDNLGISDVSICGMGGELIASILEACEYIKEFSVNLVLQPMTHVQDLRRYLFDAGFKIDDEVLCKETGKLYVCICAHYVGSPVPYTELDTVLGKILPKKEHDELFCEMCERTLYHFINRQKSTDASEAQTAKKLYDEIKEVLG